MGRKEIIVGATFLVLCLLPAAVSAGLLTAADWDDNNNYYHFEDYLEDVMDSYPHSVPDVEMNDRVSFFISDKNGDGLPNPHLTFTPEGSEEPILDTYGCYDGWFRFFPTLDGDGTVYDRYEVKISPSEQDEPSTTIELDLSELNEERRIDVRFEDHVYNPPEALDLAFVVDTTGSMGDELNYLTNEFEDIVSGVRQRFQVDSMRFGLVVYRDETDEYVTRSYDFTDSVEGMRSILERQVSHGGGDYEEAVEKGLREGIELSWRGGNTARMMFHVADAPPHQNRMEETLEQILRARDKGIHIYPLASSGIGDIAEFTMRLSEVLAHGRYLFLTDDSGIGNPHAEPHIPFYVVTTLEDLMVRLVESELRGRTVHATEDEIIRVVGYQQGGTIPDDDDNTTPGEDINETHDQDTNTTGNETDPHSDPSYDDTGDHDYPDGSEGPYPSPPGIYDRSEGGIGDHTDPSYYDDDDMYASYYEYDGHSYDAPASGPEADSPAIPIWITMLGVCGLLLVLSTLGGRKLSGKRKR
jgi:hypothetical protein